MCTCLQAVDIEDRTNKDLAEQIIKVFEGLCSREATSIYEQDGLRYVLDFINNCYSVIHKDSLQSALNVVVKLIGKIDPQNSSTLDQTIESLSNLLLHDDPFVADNALRCFATLADRFARKNVDPEPLMRYCLKDVLLRSLHHVSKTSSDTHNTSNIRGVTTNLSVVTGLLSTLCRGSAKVTYDLLRSDLPDALESALCSGDERRVLDIMRFLDLLIVLLFEGRQALPLTGSSSRTINPPAPPSTETSRLTTTTTTTTPAVAPTAGAGADRAQQQIIEHIRSRDLKAFKKYIEENQIDINYTDNVGQTMLNWVAAFGTREMVEYLCQRGADVNRGQRSSSLHYAACFGRPPIVRLLLDYGANVDLRDEDGRTALDKARERQDEDHQEVIEILQSTGHKWNDTKDLSSEQQEQQQNKGDIDMQMIYLERLLSIFCQLYQNTMILTIKRNTLRLISKLLQYANVEQIQQLNILTKLFELLATILDTNEDDDDTANLVLLLLKNLFEKSRDLFLEQFQYLGIISKITSLAQTHQNTTVNSEQTFRIKIIPIDTKEFLCYRPYVWNEFSFVRNRECIYVWNQSLVIELSMGSNGWFRFFANNSLSTMYSSGIPETNVDTDEYRQEFIEKFQRLKQQIFESTNQEKEDNIIIARTIFTSDLKVDNILTIGNWTFQCTNGKQIRIKNIEGEQITILEHGETGFTFESNRGTRQIHHVENSLINELSQPWLTIEYLTMPTNTYSISLNKNSKQEQTKQRTSEIAYLIYNEYLKNISLNHYTRSILIELERIVNDLNNELNRNSNLTQFECIFQELKTFLLEKTSLSLYELSSSGLVSVLLKLFHDVFHSTNDQTYQRAKLFCSIFLSDGQQSKAFQMLISKLISILESVENLPLFLYDAPFNYGLQIFSKRFRFQIQYKNQQQLFTDRTGKTLKIEPLATVGQLKNFLASMVSKQWFDHTHQHLEFVKQIKQNSPLTFTYTNDFDENGILYWIGTNGKTSSDYTNPITTGLVSINCSDTNCSSQQLADIVSHTLSNDDNDETTHGYNWIILDLGLMIYPTHISLRHTTGGNTNWTKTILFQFSKDTIHFSSCDTTIVNETNPSPTATWSIKNLSDNSTGYRYIRIYQKCARHPMLISGMEIYGQVLSAIDIRSKTELARTRSKPSYSQSHSTSSTSSRTNKMQSHIIRRLVSMDPTLTSSGQTTIDRILLDLSSIPTDFSTALESDDPERLRVVIEETLTRLTGDTNLNDNANLLNLISQRKSVSTPDISNGQSTFSVSTSEQASSADNLARTSDQVVQLMQGYCDQIARQYDTLVTQTQGETTISTDDFVTPTRTDLTDSDSWLELGEFNDESTILSTQLQQSAESLCPATEENNKKNSTTDSSEQRILIENDMNASVPNLSSGNLTSINILTAAQSSPNLTLTTPTTINLANIPIIDDENQTTEQTKPTNDCSMSDDDDDDDDDDDEEHIQLKRLKSTNEQIQAPVEEDEDEDEDDEDEEEEQPDEEEEEYNEELQEHLHGRQQEVTQRNWDDDFVLKRQFSVLLPAFDGRPGRTNINATQDIPVPTSMTPKEESSTKRMTNVDALAAANMSLFICGPTPNLPGLKKIEIEMTDPDATIFNYVQQLINPYPSSQRCERIKKIFEPTYTIIYTENTNEQVSTEINLPICESSSNEICSIEDILELLSQLYKLSTDYIQTHPHADEHNISIDSYFYSKKLNNKLLQQIQDSILIASSSLPSWTSWLTQSFQFLYPFETRQLYFRTTSFGTSRSIVWLQERREELIRTVRNGNQSRTRVLNENSLHEFRFGRLKIDRAGPIDRENILHDAMNLFHFHAASKSKLEIQFLNEEGTGDGPTLEFYALVAQELQKYQLGLWWNHDDLDHHQTDYVRKLEGLFPVPYPQDHSRLEEICNYFSMIGIFFGKCLLDKYLIDMPLSISFLKLLCTKSMNNEIWYDGILDINDLILIEPSRGRFFRSLLQLIEKRNSIRADTTKTDQQKQIECQQLKIENDAHEPIDIEHLWFVIFVFFPLF